MSLKERDSFVFYRSWYESAKLFENNLDKSKYIEAIIEYALDQVEPKFNDIVSTQIWTLTKPNLDANIKKYKDGCVGAPHGKKGGRPKKKEPHNNPTKTPNVNVNVNEPVKEKVNKKDNDIDKRKAEFKKLLSKYQDIYVLDMMKDFFSYWTEHSPNDRKMRFEKQTSFSVGRRLRTWKENSKKNYSKNIVMPKYGN